jgi:predicted PhzF superfamily epimerase YddE/YHI9
MARFRYVVADVFTDTPLQGNQVAVFTDARDIPEHRLQELAREDQLLGLDVCARSRTSPSSLRSAS